MSRAKQRRASLSQHKSAPVTVPYPQTMPGITHSKAVGAQKISKYPECDVRYRLGIHTRWLHQISKPLLSVIEPLSYCSVGKFDSD